MRPKYSIAIPAYNRREYLRQAILGIVHQSVSDWEVVVSDDCSTEDLGAIVKSFNDPRVKYHRSNERLGATRNHQRAVSLSKGKYIVTLNSDDLLLPNCLARVGEALEQYPKAGAVFYSMTYLKDKTLEGWQTMPHVYFADAKVTGMHTWLTRYVGTSPSSCAFRREAFEEIGGYMTSLRFAYDWEFYMRMLRSRGVIFLPEILGVSRHHEEQMVLNHSIDGLRDMLDLWRLPEYNHWPAAMIADKVFNEIRILQLRGDSWYILMRELKDRKILFRVAFAMVVPICQRFARRVLQLKNRTIEGVEENYCSPVNCDEAIVEARKLIAMM